MIGLGRAIAHVKPFGYLGHARVSLGYAAIFARATGCAIAHALLPNLLQDHSTVRVPRQIQIQHLETMDRPLPPPLPLPVPFPMPPRLPKEPS